MAADCGNLPPTDNFGHPIENVEESTEQTPSADMGPEAWTNPWFDRDLLLSRFVD
jgi:hypothetical protein